MWSGLHRTLHSLLSSSFLLETHFSIWRMSQCSGNAFLTGGGKTEALSTVWEITKYHRQQAPEAASCPWTLFPAREWLARASLNSNYLWRQGTQEGQVIHQMLVLPGVPWQDLPTSTAVQNPDGAAQFQQVPATTTVGIVENCQTASKGLSAPPAHSLEELSNYLTHEASTCLSLKWKMLHLSFFPLQNVAVPTSCCQ